ncbi:MAG: 4-hydroxy-3-methylbut-2-enyl diphosphate reductase, partial [Bacteroidetes bacterium RIFCSPHIGHO2_02_FULL_44_7]
TDDIVIIPAFGTTVEIIELLTEKGLDIHTYNSTCPFVEKVWNRSTTLGDSDYTIVIHGKHEHEETKATFSHSRRNAPSIVVRDMHETQLLVDFLLGKMNRDELLRRFQHKISKGFNPDQDLKKIGVVNQTTMLATETQEIANLLYTTMVQVHGQAAIQSHFADTRDTLCYATNDNQSATLELLKSEADLAVVVGGYNSSNTSHLVELLEQKFVTYYIKNADEIISRDEIDAYDIHTATVHRHAAFLPEKDALRIVMTSGASCPDSTMDQVMQKILSVMNIPNIEDVIV